MQTNCFSNFDLLCHILNLLEQTLLVPEPGYMSYDYWIQKYRVLNWTLNITLKYEHTKYVYEQRMAYTIPILLLFFIFHISFHIDHNVLLTSRVEMLMQLLNGTNCELILRLVCVFKCVSFYFMFCIKFYEIAFSVKMKTKTNFQNKHFSDWNMLMCES